MAFKRTILLDLDGVLNEYIGGFDENFIQKPKEGVEDFLKQLSSNFEMILFTTRDKSKALEWLIENKLEQYFKEITNEKKLSWLIVDDRCLKFEGDYNRLFEQIKNFKPWYKQ